MIGRAARHVEGSVIMYADTVTKSMQRAIDETNRRRRLQTSFNERYNITPRGIKKEIKTLSERIKEMSGVSRSEEHTSELQSQSNLVCRLLLEKKKQL